MEPAPRTESIPHRIAPAAPARVEQPVGELLNRELSWLEFNRRVLNHALDDRNPLLERVRFLGIFSSNLDEYFMKRVGGLRRQAAHGLVSRTQEGVTQAQVFAAVRQAVLPMIAQQAACFTRDVRPKLAEHGIHILKWEQLSDEERGKANRFFRQNVFPVLTPLAVDPGHPFPFISNLSTSLGVILAHPDRDERSFARVKVPEVIPGLIQLDGDVHPGEYRFVALQEMIRHNLQDLFPGMNVIEVMPFRLTRDADVERDEEEADDLRDLIEQELRDRRFARVVRIEHGPNPNPWMLQFLLEELKLNADDVYELPAELDYEDLRPVADLNLPKLRFEPWTPCVPPALADDETDIFSVIRQGDILVHHPYESFNQSVERFVKSAAEDPKVLAIKMTVYRTGDDSPFIHTLIRAAEARKQVVCLVELQARFDEERNILLAQRLEKAGCHVVYGVVGLKTHTKTTLVVRQDPDGIRCYAHVGTGNYHSQTARLYTDLGLLTCRPDVTEDLVELFHFLTGRSLQRDYRKLIIAPTQMRERFLAMIDREIEHRQAGRPAYVLAKMNSLEDGKIIRALYKASAAGVKIDLIVRGFCVLRPGFPGLSENIRVISVIGRFLEHARIFHFRNGAENPLDGEFYIGSADWMYRNLMHRIEAVAPIDERSHRERLWEILQVQLNDKRSAWDLHPDGSYTQRRPGESDDPRGAHQILMESTKIRCAAPAAAGK